MAGHALIAESIHRNSKRRFPLIGRKRRPVIAIAATNNREIGLKRRQSEQRDARIATLLTLVPVVV